MKLHEMPEETRNVLITAMVVTTAVEAGEVTVDEASMVTGFSVGRLKVMRDMMISVSKGLVRQLQNLREGKKEPPAVDATKLVGDVNDIEDVRKCSLINLVLLAWTTGDLTQEQAAFVLGVDPQSLPGARQIGVDSVMAIYRRKLRRGS